MSETGYYVKLSSVNLFLKVTFLFISLFPLYSPLLKHSKNLQIPIISKSYKKLLCSVFLVCMKLWSADLLS